MEYKVLIVEDDQMIVEIVEYNLKKEGYKTLVAYDGAKGAAMALSDDPDLILLDVMLPSMDGFEVCRMVREKSQVPIIMLTAREEEADKVLGLELGADDYITKPFSMRELMARVKANMRRVAKVQPERETAGDNLNIGNLRIDLNRFEVQKNGAVIDITVREFDILKFLASNPDKAFSREQLMEEVWGYTYGDPRTVDVAIRRLREKIENDPANPQYLLTKRGIGYCVAK